MKKLTLALLAAALVTAPIAALAYEDATVYSAQTSTSGASVAFAVRPGTTIALQSLTCTFHYRFCTTSSCTAVDTDPFIPQGLPPYPEPLKGDRTYAAVKCDGSSSGSIIPSDVVSP